MIIYIDAQKMADTGFRSELKDLCRSQGICGCRLLCLVEGYGGYGNIIDLWVQYSDGRMTSAAVKYGADMTVVMSGGTDAAELRGFIEMTGAAAVSFDRPFYEAGAVGAVMECREIRKAVLPQDTRTETDVPLVQAYELMKKCEGQGFVCPEYEDFMLDASHKLRHGNALCCGLYKNDRLCSFAMTAAMTEDTAVIGAVCTGKEARKQGFGSAVVLSLVNMLGNRRILLARDIDLNENFYKRLGFRDTMSLYILDLNKRS